MKEIGRQLYLRGMHRMFGHPTIGTFCALLSGIFIIRASANLYFVRLLSSGGVQMDLSQISAGWFLYLGLYLSCCGSLSAFHISFVLPQRSFVGLQRSGRRFRRLFLGQAALLRPMNLAVLVLSVVGFYILARTGASAADLASGLVLLLISAAAGSFIFRFTAALSPGMIDSQILEFVSLLFIVMLNPEVMAYGGHIRIGLRAEAPPFDRLYLSIAAVATVSLILSALLVAVKLLSGRGRPRSYKAPLLGWYFRYFGVKFWFLLYLIAVPAFSLPILSSSLKRSVYAGFVLFCLASWLLFINHCDNQLAESLGQKAALSRGRRLFAKPAALHLLLTLLPLAGLFV